MTERPASGAGSAPTLPDYPFDWSELEDFSYARDANGIPMVDIGAGRGLRYNPITIAQYGLFQLQCHSRSTKKSHLDDAGKCAAWLLDNFRDWRAGLGAWIYDDDLDFYGPTAPWISGMAQAQGISLLLRFFQHKTISGITEIVRRAFQAFQVPVHDGGVLEHFGDGTPVFEEFPTTPASKVLNGHMFALLGIHDYAVYFDDRHAKALFTTAAEGLAANLSLYDNGYWNLYDLHPTHRLASPDYLLVHVRLLRILAKLTGHPGYEVFAEKWQQYHSSHICRGRWFLTKVYEKIRLRS